MISHGGREFEISGRQRLTRGIHGVLTSEQAGVVADDARLTSF
jgi:hypothetical protein